ncbi:MAG: UDP-N-acetylmuramate dehydrogenase [Actinobacteria bacterium]|nr:UDP-N-acetylmuramate dehydrogenase [Actinomycetota bacterium]
MSESLRDYTTLHIGGPAKKFLHATTEAELINAVSAADSAGEPVLIIGGGSNVLVGDEGFSGTVIRVETKGNSYAVDACSGGMISVAAGEDWDEFVEWIIGKGFAGVETLSGIPGTVGASPIQNIGAYGHEVSEVIARVRTWDRKAGELKTLSNTECEFAYRTSKFKKEKDRYVVLEVTFQLRQGEMSLPIAYKELADYLGVELGARALVSDVRKAVLELRSRKGMVINKKDHDTWSAGSFFVNPIVDAAIAAKLPSDAPKWPQSDGRVKLSAAWLMERSGVNKGSAHNGAGVSSKHVLALVNNGSATSADMVELARSAKAAVREKFGIELEPEVRFVGCDL